MSKVQPVSPSLLTQAGVLPILEGPVRFAVGAPDGASSNSWRVWATGDDIYLKCRDNMREVKVSLHASGRWRMGFTSEAIKERPDLVALDEDRSWDVWDRPPTGDSGLVPAFRLIFPRNSLVLGPDQRPEPSWRGVVFIEGPPEGKLTVVTLFVNAGERIPVHAGQPSFCLASFELANGQRAQLVAHAEEEGSLRDVLRQSVEEVRKRALAANVVVPPGAVACLFGVVADGSRMIVVSPVGTK